MSPQQNDDDRMVDLSELLEPLKQLLESGVGISPDLGSRLPGRGAGQPHSTGDRGAAAQGDRASSLRP